jgi:hypothetical protein
MFVEQTTGGGTQARDPDCFEEWLLVKLLERRDRQNEVGRVARWVLRENKEGRWAPGIILLSRHGHAYDVPAHYERVLRHAENFPEEAVQAFFRVYDLYLRDDSAEYDRMVEERGRGLDEEFAGTGNGGGGSTTGTEDAEGADEAPEKGYSQESWNRFFYEIHGAEQLGYELDEDGYPIDKEPDGGAEGG